MIYKTSEDAREQNSKSDEERALDWLQRFKKSSAHTQANIVCTIIVAIATIAYVIAAFQQLSELRRTNDLTQQALAGSADTLSKTLEKMQRQIDAANTANENTARLVQANFIMWTAVSGERGHINVAVKNIGKMTASDVIATGQMRLASIRTGEILKRQDIVKKLGTVQPEGSPDRALWFDIPKFTNPDNISTDSELSSYFGDKVIYVTVALHYNGGFGKTIDQKFCKAIIADASVNSNHNLFPEMPECEDAPYYIDLRKRQIRDESDGIRH